MTASDFGVVIATYPGDYHFAKATCESIRQYMPDVPICLIVDGNLSVSELVRVYEVQVVRIDDVKNKFLREESFGFGFTKMVAFWEVPFERFLYLDADAVIWGDIRTVVDVEAADLISSSPHEANTVSKVTDQYFDPVRLQELEGPIDWEGQAYFNSGVFIARRGCLSLDAYRRLFRMNRSHEGVFIAGEQGILNLLAIQAKGAQTLTWAHAPLQQIMGSGGMFDGWGGGPWRDPSERFHIQNGAPTIRPEDCVVLHWAAGKPLIKAGAPGAEIMTHFRRQAFCRMYPWLAPVADRILKLEERTWVARWALRKGPRHMWGVVSREASRVARRLSSTRPFAS